MICKPFKDLSLSCLGLGNMRLPTCAQKEGNPIDREAAGKILDYAMEHGVNYYDTAYVYNNGDSEKFLGETITKYPRKSYYLATKFNIMANPDYKSVFEEQLKRLNTDYIDFYLIHAVMDNNSQKYIDSGCIDYFNELKKQGKIRYLGFSNHSSPETLKMFIKQYDWDFVQIQLNYFDWEYGSAKKEYEIIAENNLPVIVMEPVRGGRLAGLTDEANELLKTAQPDWSIASWAFRWLKTLPQVQVVLSGMSNMEQVIDNVNTFSDAECLSDKEVNLLFKAREMFKDQIQVPCTACRYCCDECPKKIDIPKVLSVYNEYKLNGDWTLEKLKKSDEPGPKDCIGCGKCTVHCPQSIGIPEIMNELKSKF